MREGDGLAMSSRNKHLKPDERKQALAISRSLRKAEALVNAGERDSHAIIVEMKKIIDESNPTKIDYISVVQYDDLAFIDVIEKKSVIAAAVFYGTTRLIDNMILDMDGGIPICIY